MPEEGNPNPQGLSAGSQEFEDKEIELSDEDREELSKIDWYADPDAEEQDTDSKPEAEAEDVPEATEVEYELPGGDTLTAEQIAELRALEKRYKDLQADYTRKAQENAELRQKELAQQYMRDYQPPPQFQPEPFQPTPLENAYATETERVLAERLQRLEEQQKHRDYQEWVKNQREAMERSNNLVSSFRGQHSELSDDQVAEIIAKANQAGTFDLELVYRGMRNYDAELQQARELARKELVEELRKKQGAKLEPSAQPSKAEPKLDVRKLTDEQRAALMVKELTGG